MPPPRPKINYEADYLPNAKGELWDQMEKKTTRYFPGKAPKWAEDKMEDDEPDLFGTGGDPEPSINTATDAASDRRLARLAARERDEAARLGRRETTAQVVDDDSSDDEATQRRARARQRRQQTAEVVEDSDDDVGGVAQEAKAESSDDDDARERRRAAARAKYQQRQKDEQAQEELAEEKEEADESDEESSEWETDTDDEDNIESVTRLKPKFVPRDQRVTILEQERLEEEQAKLEEKEAEKKKDRVKESRTMVEDILKKEEEDDKEDLSDDDMPDDDDEINEYEEYHSWKLREAGRIKKERDERERAAKELAETLRRRGLTDKEREAEDAAAEAKAKADGKVQDKGKWKYLQKYYHKGAFFQDTNKFGVSEYDELFNRDFGGATLDDNYDKQAMPKVMQVKKFGHAGRTKYTHLVDQDTSQKDSAWAQRSSLREAYNQKMGGMGEIARPKKKTRTGQGDDDA